MWLFVVFHCIVCLIVYVLMKARILKSSSMIMGLVLLVPVFGFGCLLFLEWESWGKQEAKKEAGIEKLKINDEIHKSILMEEDPAQNLVVPLQEALLMNDASIRRELMMDILYDDAGDYVEVLKGARMNDDTEVVHYATTAMAELQKDYEQKLGRQKEAYEEDTENAKLLEEYTATLGKYVESGLLEGNMLRVQRTVLGGLMERLIEIRREDGMESMELYQKKFENSLFLEEYADALQQAEYVIDMRPLQEDGYLMKIRCAIRTKDREEIRRVIGLIGKNGIYLSPAGRKAVEFWKDDDGGES